MTSVPPENAKCQVRCQLEYVSPVEYNLTISRIPDTKPLESSDLRRASTHGPATLDPPPFPEDMHPHRHSRSTVYTSPCVSVIASTVTLLPASPSSEVGPAHHIDDDEKPPARPDPSDSHGAPTSEHPIHNTDDNAGRAVVSEAESSPSQDDPTSSNSVHVLKETMSRPGWEAPPDPRLQPESLLINELASDHTPGRRTDPEELSSEADVDSGYTKDTHPPPYTAE